MSKPQKTAASRAASGGNRGNAATGGRPPAGETKTSALAPRFLDWHWGAKIDLLDLDCGRLMQQVMWQGERIRDLEERLARTGEDSIAARRAALDRAVPPPEPRLFACRDMGEDEVAQITRRGRRRLAEISARWGISKERLGQKTKTKTNVEEEE